MIQLTCMASSPSKRYNMMHVWDPVKMYSKVTLKEV